MSDKKNLVLITGQIRKPKEFRESKILDKFSNQLVVINRSYYMYPITKPNLLHLEQNQLQEPVHSHLSRSSIPYSRIYSWILLIRSGIAI